MADLGRFRRYEKTKQTAAASGEIPTSIESIQDSIDETVNEIRQVTEVINKVDALVAGIAISVQEIDSPDYRFIRFGQVDFHRLASSFALTSERTCSHGFWRKDASSLRSLPFGVPTK